MTGTATLAGLPWRDGPCGYGAAVQQDGRRRSPLRCAAIRPAV